MVNWLDPFNQWMDRRAKIKGHDRNPSNIDWVRVWPYIGMHLACLAVLWVGWSPVALVVAFGIYALRVLALTGFYHRFFAHKSFSTSRPLAFIFAFIGASSAQRGPIWWAAHHRHHHMSTDKPDDPHSPSQHGFWRAHTGWFLTREHFPVREEKVRDLLRCRELVWLDRFDILAPIALGAFMFGLGAFLERFFPQLGTSAGQMLVWGFFVSTVLLYHVTFAINSLAHRFGSRRYDTKDDSKNNWLLALLSFGEGWHNNHHHYPASARQGFYWWEVDITYYFLRTLAAFGLVWDLKSVPRARRESHRQPAMESAT